ncbi:MAG: TraI domain-containing protein [bacterium]|jgi:hypothetical protein|nr:TraI domain-containing protein [Betaproteobacteria bacterium]
MGLIRDGAQAAGREIPAMDLAALVQRHAAGFGRVRACGDLGDLRFRRIAGPLLLAFARHAHLLPTRLDAPCGSLLDAGLEACADALLSAATGGAAPSRPAAGFDRQEAIVLHALSPWVVVAIERWKVCLHDGHGLVLAASPLSDQLEEAMVSRHRSSVAVPYRIAPGTAAAPGGGRPGARLLGMVLLLRALPGPALAAACAPPLLDAALALSLPEAGAPAAPAGPTPQQVRDAMHALIAEGQWTLNVRRSRLWYLEGRLYLAWKTAAKELALQLSVDPAQLLPVLVRQGIVLDGRPSMPDATGEPSGALVEIRTPYTEALPVVELADAAGWLRSLPHLRCAG